MVFTDKRTIKLINNNSMNNLIFCDLDGTLLNSKHKVTNKTRQVIIQRIAKNDIFIPVSARSPEAIKTVTNQIDNKIHFPVIAYSGALILNEKGKIIFSASFPGKIASQICHFIDTNYPNLVWNVYTKKDKWFVKDVKNKLVLHEQNNVLCRPLSTNLDFINSIDKIYKILILGNNADRIRAKNQLKQQYTKLNIQNLIEITSKKANKGKAVQILAGNNPNTYGFGDHESDLPMLEVVNHPYAMKNADANVKKAIHSITDDNDHNGVAKILIKLK